ncbi:MAG: glycosyltransferase [Chloroflexi bacterium]|nr:glycosyltransferase [Chloroflexota bacterium]
MSKDLAPLLGLFGVLTLLVQTRLLAQVDELGLGFVVQLRSAALTEVMNWIFRLGFVQVDAALALLWAGGLLVRRRSLRAALPPLVLFLAIGFQAGLRLVVDQPAPGSAHALDRAATALPVEHPVVQAGYALDQADTVAREAFVAAAAGPAAAPSLPARPPRERGSFPSGHACRGLFLALLAIDLVRRSASRRARLSRWLGQAAPLALAGLVGYSAMYYGYHWPSDVLGGFLLALAAYQVAAWLREGEGARERRSDGATERIETVAPGASQHSGLRTQDSGLAAALRASVVIPARDAARQLDGCLAALAAGSSGVAPHEVIVVDDGSTDATAEVARARQARVLRLSGLGPAAARNAGARAACGEVLVFFDADCVPEAGCLEALLAPFADPRVAGVRGGYTSRQRAVVARFTQLELEEKQARLAASRQIAVVDTACAAYRRTVLLDYGGFDESFPSPSAEDVDLSFRLAARGERLVYAPGARVRHRHPEGLARYLFRKLRFGYYRARLYRRFPSRLREDGYTPRLMPVQIALAGLLAAAAVASPWLALGLPLAQGAGLAFLATSLPLARRAWATDRPLVPLVPLLLLARSLAQGLGLLLGLLALGLHRAASRRRAPVAAERVMSQER